MYFETDHHKVQLNIFRIVVETNTTTLFPWTSILLNIFYEHNVSIAMYRHQVKMTMEIEGKLSIDG